jgi:hypothetical protein
MQTEWRKKEWNIEIFPVLAEKKAKPLYCIGLTSDLFINIEAVLASFLFYLTIFDTVLLQKLIESN